jgi:hypothetical protein
MARTLLQLVQKTCTSCNEIKPISDFYKESRGRGDGYVTKCKPCTRIYLTSYRKTDAGKRTQRKYNLKYYYGLTPEKYEAMLEEANHVCELCGQINQLDRRLNVDHNHSTGAVRGLLCTACNTTLGLIEENMDWFDRAKAYLRKHNG